MGRRIGTSIVAFVALAGAAPSQVSAQTGTVPTVNAGRLSSEQATHIRVDGLLDESAWRDVSAATDFRQQEPFEGVAATERTEVRVLFDETTLYIGVLAHDSDPNGVIARILQCYKVMQASDGGQPEFTGAATKVTAPAATAC